MKLTVIGCSPAWPNPGGAQSGYLLEGAGGSLLLECGPGVLAKLRRDGGWPRIDAIAITHFHLDHWGDLVPWVWGSLYSNGNAPTRTELWVPASGRRTLDDLAELLGSADMFERVFALREYEPETPFTAAGFTVTAGRVAHYGMDAYAFRVDDGSVTVAYSGDSGPEGGLADIARDADLFLCEATLADGSSDGEPRGHLSLDEAMAVFRASGAKRLLVVHRPAELPSHGVEVAADGMIVEV